MHINVAVVGLGFGADFVPIYLHHPDVGQVTICDSNESVLNEVGGKFQVRDRCSDFQAVLESDEIDAVHLVTPLSLHAPQAIAVLEAGKHCACTVPMALALDDLRAIIAAQRRSKRNYMMMETAVYTREFLFVRDLVDSGALGKIQFLRGAHYQDLERWPPYWRGLPPLHYATHAVAPLLSLAKTRATVVHCFGSGSMRAELQQVYGNPYPIETAIFQLEHSDVAAEVTRSLFHTARAYTESFTVLGDKMSFEWQQLEEEAPVLFRMGLRGKGRDRTITAERVLVPDRADLLPKEIARFTKEGFYDEQNPHLSFLEGGGHSGSHPHLVNEFIRSIVEDRAPAIDVVTAANWTAVGICAHESAIHGGARVEVPRFSDV